MLEFFLIAVDLLLRARRGGKGRDHETGIKFYKNTPEPFKIFGFSFDFPADADWSIFVASNCFDCIEEFCLFNELVD